MASSIPEYATKNINFISSDPFRANYDVQTTLMEHTFKKLAGDLYKPDTMGGLLFYAGVVFSITENVPLSKDSTFSFASIFGLSSPETKKVREYKIFIPEIFKGLIAPKIFSKNTSINDLSKEDQKRYVESLQAVKSLPTIIDFHVGDEEPIDVGDMVWVMFQNGNTREKGFLFSKIMSDSGISAGFTTNDVILPSQDNPSPYSQPPEISKTQADTDQEKLKEPPGFNGKWLVDYSAIIDIMGSSKGWPYRFGWFPVVYDPGKLGEDARKAAKERTTDPENEESQKRWNEQGPRPLSAAEYQILLKEKPNANDITGAFSDWEYGLIGVDCVGFVRRALVRCGIIDPKMKCPDELAKKWNSKTVGELMCKLGAANFSDLADPIKLGDQLPGDFCMHGFEVNVPKHATFVVSYPDTEKNNHSIVWGANGGTAFCDADCQRAGVGCNKTALANTENNSPLNTLALFTPTYGDFYNGSRGYFQYYRIKKELVSKTFKQKTRTEILNLNESNKNLFGRRDSDNFDASAWPFSRESTNLKMFPKTHPRQYIYPSKISEHPPSVINAPDLFYDKRRELEEKEKK